MTGPEILNVIMVRLGTGSGVTSINTELQGVLYDITSRADFYTTVAQVSLAAGGYEYDQPEGLKQVYEVTLENDDQSSAWSQRVLEKKTYRDYQKAREVGNAVNIFEPGEPKYYALRRDKMYVWPRPDTTNLAYHLAVDYTGYHPVTWTDILLGSEFHEAIFEGVLAALYRGQLFEKLRLNNKTITDRDTLANTSLDRDIVTVHDADGTADDTTDTTDDSSVNSVETDVDSDVMKYEFDKDFPEIRKHAEAYEAEIAKLIGLQQTETVLVEYRDI